MSKSYIIGLLESCNYRIGFAPGAMIRFFRRSILRSIGALAFLAIGTAASAEAPASFFGVPPDWRFEEGGASVLRSEVSDLIYDGARAQVLRIFSEAGGKEEGASKAPRGIWQLLHFDLTHYNRVSFKARLKDSGGLTLFAKGPNSLSLRQDFHPSGQPDKFGFYHFVWEIPPQREGLGTVVEELQIFPDASLSPGDKASEIEIIDFIVSGPGSSSKEAPMESGWGQSGPQSERAIPLEGWKPRDAIAGEAINVEVVQTSQGPALQLTFRHAEKFTPVALPFSIDANEYNVLSFQAKVEIPQGVKALGEVEAPMTGWFSEQFNEFFDNFGVALQDARGLDWVGKGVPSTHFLQHLDRSQPEQGGFRTFRWDMKNENRTGNKGFDLEAVSEVVIFFDNRKIKPGEKVVVTIANPRFIKGLFKKGGDPARYEAFRTKMANYAPDYSDSSKFLGPPEQGRLEQPLPLTKDGVALGEIVGAPSVWEPEGNAVIELYRWLFRLTGGTKIPVVSTPSEGERTRIFIGAKFAEKYFSEDLEYLKGSDGCAIRTKGNDVYIFGATGKGTLNGVYTFLEGNTDVIWPRPSDLFGSVYSENPSLSIVWGDYRHRPEARHWGWMGATSGPGLEFQIRNRANYVGLRSSVDFPYWGLYMEEGGGHNLHSWIPWSLWPSHPEYWVEIDGERRHPNAYTNQICLTNPDGRAIFIKRVREVMDRNPSMSAADCMNIKIEDNWGSCECEECLRPIRLPDGTILPKDDIAFRSTQFFMFLNEVANAIHNAGRPKLQIGTYVYFFTVPVPKIPVTAFLRPYFCDYVRKDYKVPIFAPINDIWWRTLNAWTKVSDKVVIREYTGIYVYFRPMAEVAAYDIQAELDAGAREFTSESLPVCSSAAPGSVSPMGENLDVAFMEYWMILRLYWDPTADVEQLRKYFIRRTFREAAPEMEKFYGVIRELYFKEKRTTDFEEHQETLRLVIARKKDDELRGYLQEALQKVRHPLSRKMIVAIRDSYEKWISGIKMEQKGA